jgi:endonuclease YncB( thermonuclease family)
MITSGMKRLYIYIIFIFAGWLGFPWLSDISFRPQTVSARQAQNSTTRVQLKFIRCHDGDTCVASTQEGILMTIRLLGVDAPEKAKTQGPMRLRSDGQIFGKESHLFVEQKVQDKKLWVDVSGTDVYNRYLGIIYPPEFDPNTQGPSLNQQIIEEGYAYAYRATSKKVPPSPDWAFAAELSAQKNKKGFWALEQKPQNPSDFRRMKKKKN